MFVEVLALERGEGKGNVWQSGTLAGVEMMCTEVIPSDLNSSIMWRGESRIFENLGMYGP